MNWKLGNLSNIVYVKNNVLKEKINEMKINKRIWKHFSIKHVLVIIIFGSIFFIAKAQNTYDYNGFFKDLPVKNTHPRIFVDAEKLAFLKKKCQGKTPSEVLEMAGTSLTGFSLAYLITGDEKIGKEAIKKAFVGRVRLNSKYFDLNTVEGDSKRNSFQSFRSEQALCYDWCYPLFTEKEKIELRKIIIEEAKKDMAFKRAFRSFHNGLFHHAYPLTTIALAVYGEDPFGKEALEFLKPELEDVMKTFDYVFPDGEWPEGMDYNRHSTYQALRILKALQTATGKKFMSRSPHIRNTGAYIIYSVKPNGLALPCDDNDWPYLGPWERQALLVINDEFRDGYNQYFLNHIPFERFKFETNEKYSDLLWYDASIAEKPIHTLPLSRIFRGKGLVMARNNWDFDTNNKKVKSTWLSFHCGDYLGDHVHDDINSFTISHKGELAIDAGRYDDDWEAVIGDSSKALKSQFFNYYKRAIAHNTILITDTSEKIKTFYPLVNDAGQIWQLRSHAKNDVRNVPEDYEQGNYPSEDGIATCDWKTNPGRWETGEILSYKSTPHFMYVKGDGTKAYAATKMKSYTRQLLFLQPDIVVVMDRVVSVDPAFKKSWLLHSTFEPMIGADGKSFELADGDGKLTCISILPKDVKLNKVGGSGNEFLVDTVHYKCCMNSAFDPTEPHYAEIPGAWRMEESPKYNANEDYFLNIIRVGDKAENSKPAYRVLADNMKEIIIQISLSVSKKAVITFTKGVMPSARIKIINGKKILVDENMPDKIVLEKGRTN